MSTSNTMKNTLLKTELKGIDPAYRANATQYIAYLQTDSAGWDPANPLATECDYTGYVRTPVTKASAWTDNGTNFSNAGTLNGGKRMDAGAVQTIRAAVVVDTVSGAVTQCIFGELASPIAVTQNIKPTCEPGSLIIRIQP